MARLYGRVSLGPVAAWGYDGLAIPCGRLRVAGTNAPYQHLEEFLSVPHETPVEERATAGFLSRTQSSCLRLPDGFLLGPCREHLMEQMRETGVKGGLDHGASKRSSV